MYVKLVVRDSSHPAEPLRSFPKGQVMKRTSPFCHVRSHQPRTQILVFNHILSRGPCAKGCGGALTLSSLGLQP